VRVLFLLLVLANVALFAWARFIAGGGSGADPAPVARQIEPEKLRVVSPDELAKLAPAKPAVAARPTPPTAAAPPSPAPLKCIEWGSFTLADAAHAEKALEPLGLGERLAQRKTEETAAWWVFIPPQAGPADARQAALRKAGELKKLGVDDYFIVQEEGANRWAVSLGVFRSEEAAQARLAALRGQGVRSARIGARETHLAKVWLQVKGVDGALEGRLQELARQVEGSELRECMP
jgi:hypothetical protein